MCSRAHSTLRVQHLLTKNGMTPMSHPPYSLDLIPNTFIFVSPMKKVFKRKYFADVEEVKQKMSEALKDIKNQ